MKTLAIEADTTVNQLNENEQSFTRQVVRNNIQKLIKEEGTQKLGRSVSQAVSLRLPIAAARDRAQARSRWICGRKSGTGIRVLGVLVIVSCAFDGGKRRATEYATTIIN
jgi:hypothetical protein